MNVLRFLKRNRLAFTLVELLVVILVLGVLLAIALPSFLNAQNSAKDADAKTKLSTAYKGVKIFAGAHESTYPTGSDLVSAVNEAQPGLMNEGDPSSTADGKVGVCSESSSSEVKLVAVSASGTSFLMTTTASTGAYTIAPGACDASPPPPPDPITNVTKNPIPGASGTIYFQRISPSGQYPTAVGSMNADGTSFNADLGFPGDSSFVYNTGLLASYNAQTVVKVGFGFTIAWAAPDGSNEHSINAGVECGNIGGDYGTALFLSWNGTLGAVELSPNGDALHVWCGTDRFLNIDTATGQISRWVSPWEGTQSLPYASLYMGVNWPLSPDGNWRIGSPGNNDEGLYRIANGTTGSYTSGVHVVEPASGDWPYDGTPVFSRDGSKISWAHWNDAEQKTELWVADADGTNQVKTAATDPWGNYPAPTLFSPDGQWILYTYVASINGQWAMGVRAAKADGSGEPVTVLSTTDGVILRTLAWTGTGETFASFQN